MYLPADNFNKDNDSMGILGGSLPQRKKLRVSQLHENKMFPIPSTSGMEIETDEEEEYIDEEYLIEAEIDKDEEVENARNDQIDLNVHDSQDDQDQHRRHDPAVCCNGCREERLRFEALMLRKINQLIEQTRPGPNHPERPRNFSLIPSTPFDDINELKQFDRNLTESEEMQSQFMKKIEEIGGKTVQKAVKYALETVMTDALVQQVVWTLGAQDKPRISTFKFPYLIIDVVRNAFPGTKLKTLEDRIADWLRRGGDRIKTVRNQGERRRRHVIEHR